MRRSYLRAAIILGCLAIAVIVPVVFSGLLERQAIAQAQRTLTAYAERIIARAEAQLDQTGGRLSRFNSADLMACDSSVRRRLSELKFEIPAISGIAIINGEGHQVCILDAHGRDTAILTRIPSRMEPVDLSLLRDTASGHVMLGMVYDDLIYITFQRDSFLIDLLPEEWRIASHMALRLSDRTAIERLPRRAVETELTGPDMRVTRVSERYPFKLEITVPTALVLDAFAGIKAIVIAMITGLVLAFLALALALVRSRVKGDAEIERGMAARTFLPYYQPVISLEEGRLDGCEVLLRRRLPEGGVETPGRLIDRAEGNGQIVPLTNYLMRRVIEDLEEHYATRPHLTIAFNLCALHFHSDQIVRDVKAAFGKSRIRYSQLIFEVTERYPLGDLTTAKSVVGKLQALGCRVAIDDAGTGHGGLAVMQRLGLDIIKIDRVFVDAIDADTRQAPIVDKLLEMARGLRMSVIAEGVETVDQLRYLRQRGAGLAQGYLFAPPLPASSYRQLVGAMTPIAMNTDSVDRDAA
ncbi:MAG: EAL domain-containing protein [Pseudomonadota bacterium]